MVPFRRDPVARSGPGGACEMSSSILDIGSRAHLGRHSGDDVGELPVVADQPEVACSFRDGRELRSRSDRC